MAGTGLGFLTGQNGHIAVLLSLDCQQTKGTRDMVRVCKSGMLRAQLTQTK